MQCRGSKRSQPWAADFDGKGQGGVLGLGKEGPRGRRRSGNLWGDPGCPGGAQFFSLNICLSWSSLSLLQVKVKFDLAPFILCSMQQHVTRACAPKHVMRVEKYIEEKDEGFLTFVCKEV